MYQQKLSADTDPKIIAIVDEAAKIEGRTRANFLRFYAEKIAREIIEKNEEAIAQ